MRWLLAPAAITTLLLAIASRSAAHAWLQNHPVSLPIAALGAAIVLAPAGLYLGWRKGRTLTGGGAGAAIGAVAAAVGFAAVPIAPGLAFWAAWGTAWILVSILQSELDGRLRPGKAIRRGALAAAAGALGLGVALAQFSTAASPENLTSSSHALAWIAAYAPGAMLLIRR